MWLMLRLYRFLSTAIKCIHGVLGHAIGNLMPSLLSCQIDERFKTPKYRDHFLRAGRSISGWRSSMWTNSL